MTVASLFGAFLTLMVIENRKMDRNRKGSRDYENALSRLTAYTMATILTAIGGVWTIIAFLMTWPS